MSSASDAAVIERAIHDRRTIKAFIDQPVPRDLIERLIEAAVWAPNHRMTEPWRFYVLNGASRDALAAIAGDVAARSLRAGGADAATIDRKRADAARGWASVPAIVFITTQTSENATLDRENYGAVCCAIQNLSLLAPALGLATSWSSGGVADDRALLRLVGAGPAERMAGLLRIGYPDPASTVMSQRTPGRDLTTWLDDHQSAPRNP